MAYVQLIWHRRTVQNMGLGLLSEVHTKPNKTERTRANMNGRRFRERTTIMKKNNDYSGFVRLSACNNIAALQQQLVSLASNKCLKPVRLYQGKKETSALQLVALKEKSESRQVILDVSRRLVNRYRDDSKFLAKLAVLDFDVQHRVFEDQTIFFLRTTHDLLICLVCESTTDEHQNSYIDALLVVYANLLNQLQYSLTDALTGLLNRHAYEERMASLYHRQHANALKRRSTDRGSDGPICFAFIDIDHFKKINDEHGHLYGDEVLVWIAQSMRQFFREGDLVFRYGGEEFVVILMNSDLLTSQKILERFRRQIAQKRTPKINTVTVSIGYTRLDFQQPLSSNVSRADAAMYYSKENGRNAVNCYETLVSASKLIPVMDESQGDSLTSIL